MTIKRKWITKQNSKKIGKKTALRRQACISIDGKDTKNVISFVYLCATTEKTEGTGHDINVRTEKMRSPFNKLTKVQQRFH